MPQTTPPMTRALRISAAGRSPAISSPRPRSMASTFGRTSTRTSRSCDLALEDIPFDSEYFDFVTAFDFIEHVPRVIYNPTRRYPFVELMNEVYRVLKVGGMFFSSTPAYPHPAAFQDPTHVNIITAETFPMYFDDKARWAAMYGFKGAFKLHTQVWNGQHLETALTKVSFPSL